LLPRGIRPDIPGIEKGSESKTDDKYDEETGDSGKAPILIIAI
jgi:hypothetical protein